MNFQKVVFVLSMLLAVPVVAEQARVQFSADTVMSVPEQGTQQGRMYVGNGKLRTEMEINDTLLIQIIDITNQTAYMINTAEKSYARHKADAAMQSVTGEQENPCAAMPDTTCKKIGDEMLGQRKAEKWELSGPALGDGEPVIYWIDKEHKFPVRQIMPDGSKLEMQFIGIEKLNGRMTEKWKMTASRPGGTEQVSWRWYDPEIKVITREERPGGLLREISNIKVAPQPPALFKVPDSYQEVSGPSMGGEPGDKH